MKPSKKARRPEALECFRAAKTLAAAGSRAEAVEAYLAALELEPDFGEALVNLGILYGQMGGGQADEALRCLRRGAVVNPDSPRAHYNLGVVLAKRRTGIDEAIQAFEAAVAVDPGHKNALYALAVQWNKKGDPVKSAIYHQYYQEAMSGKSAGSSRSAAGGAVRELIALGRSSAVAVRLGPILRLRFRR